MKLNHFFILILLSALCTGCVMQTEYPKLPAGEATIKYSSWGSQSEIKIIKEVIADFEKENNAKVEFIHVPQNYFQKLHLLFASKKAPDVIFVNNYYLPLYAHAGLLKDLTPYFSQDINNNVYFTNALNALQFNGIQYAIPRDISNMVVYYNKDYFKKYNVPYPLKEWNYSDFLDTAKKLTTTSGKGVGFEENILYWEPFLWSNGENVFDKKGNLALSTQNAKDTLNFYLSLRNIYKVAPTREESANRTMAQMFLDEKIAMQISGRWLVPKYREEAKFDWDVMSLPKGSLGSVAGSDSSGWAISNSTKNTELAVKFVKYMSSYKSIDKMAKSGLFTPARIDVANSKTFLDNNKPNNAKIFLEINDNAIINNIPDDYNQKIEKLNKLLEPYFIDKEKITPDTIFEL